MQKFNLIKSLENSNLSEGGILSKIHDLMFKYDDPKPKNPQGGSKDPGTSKANFNPKANMSSDVELLPKFVGQVKAAGRLSADVEQDGMERVVVSMELAEFDSFIKGTAGSGKQYIKSLAAEQDGLVIKNLAKEFAHVDSDKDTSGKEISIFALKKGYTFGKMITLAKSELLILLDIPKKLSNGIRAIGKELANESLALDRKQELIGQAQLAFEKMMHHSHYVMTIRKSKSKKIQSAVDAVWNDESELESVLDPNIVYHYPSRVQLRMMKAQFEDQKNSSNTEQSSDAPAKEQPSVGKKLSMEKYAALVNDLNSIMNDPELGDAAKALLDKLNEK